MRGVGRGQALPVDRYGKISFYFGGACDKMKKTMPVRRWVQAMRLLFRRYFRHEVGRSAAALTYYLVFAAFPF